MIDDGVFYRLGGFCAAISFSSSNKKLHDDVVRSRHRQNMTTAVYVSVYTLMEPTRTYIT